MSFTFNPVINVNQTPGSQAVSSRVMYFKSSNSSFATRSATGANWNLFDNSAVAGDMMYFSIGSASSKIGGIRFTLSPVMASTSHTIVWEYRKTDDTWATLTVTDGTSGFTTSGDVTWTPPDDWGTDGTAINSFTGNLWVRARISAAVGITAGGRNTVAMEYFTYSVSHDAGSEKYGGTVTASSTGATASFSDSSKSWTDGELANRVMMITSGTAIGEKQVITWNVGNLAYIYGDWGTKPVSGDAYTICENFEDAYQADVAGGWGVVTKCGDHSYAFKCNLELNAASFGDVNTNIEFQNDFVWFERTAATSVYPHIFGMRLPVVFGVDKTILGNSFLFNKYSAIDNRSVGFTADSDYSFSFGNRYVTRYDFRFQSTASNLRLWMVMRLSQTINDYFEGFRSVTFPKTSTPNTEARRVEVVLGNSGIEQPFANFDGVRTHYNNSLGVFLTTATTITAPGFDVGQNNAKGSFARGPIQYYNCTGIQYIDDYKGVRTRPMRDSFLSSPNTFQTFWRSTFNCRVTDQKKQLLANARVRCTDVTGTQVFDVTTGSEGDLLGATAVSNGNTYSLTSQPASPTRIRFNVASFSDTSTTETFNARIVITGTDENDNVISELILTEEIGDDNYYTKNFFKTVATSGIAISGFSATLTVDTLGLIPKQLIAGERWQSTGDTTLVTTNYNPMKFVISRPGFDQVIVTKDVITTQDWHIPLKRSVLDIQ